MVVFGGSTEYLNLFKAVAIDLFCSIDWFQRKRTTPPQIELSARQLQLLERKSSKPFFSRSNVVPSSGHVPKQHSNRPPKRDPPVVESEKNHQRSMMNGSVALSSKSNSNQSHKRAMTKFVKSPSTPQAAIPSSNMPKSSEKTTSLEFDLYASYCRSRAKHPCPNAPFKPTSACTVSYNMSRDTASRTLLTTTPAPASSRAPMDCPFVRAVGLRTRFFRRHHQ